MHYVHTDHLGSLNVITNQGGAIEQELSFDAWGNRRSPDTWVNLTGTPANLLTRRGFTGHEHMDEFGIINMNGRMYDPVLGRFLSPDSYVQAPGFTQSYNRYSYCVNNPLLFTDPSGMTFGNNQTGFADFDTREGGGGGGIGSYSGLEGRMLGGLFASLGGLGANTSPYTYDWRSGSYIETATGEIVPSLVATNWLLSAAGKNVATYTGVHARDEFTNFSLINSVINYANAVKNNVDGLQISFGTKDMVICLSVQNDMYNISFTYSAFDNVRSDGAANGEGIHVGDVINGETVVGFCGGQPLREMRPGEGDPITGTAPLPGFAKSAKVAYTVYQGIKNGKVVYWGLTKDIVKRAQQHGIRFDRIVKVYEDLSRSAARGLEQLEIDKAGLQNLENIINGISIKNPKLMEYYREAIRHLQSL